MLLTSAARFRYLARLGWLSLSIKISEYLLSTCLVLSNLAEIVARN